MTAGRRPLRLIVAVVGLALAGAAPAATPVTVGINNFTFGPQTVTVPQGSVVTWVNRDDTPHRVVATDKGFKSPVLDTDESFSRTFSETGRFAYFCSLHPQMTGVVVVTGK